MQSSFDVSPLLKHPSDLTLAVPPDLPTEVLALIAAEADGQSLKALSLCSMLFNDFNDCS